MLRVYMDGLLVLSDTPTNPPLSLTQVDVRNYGGTSIFRGLNARSSTPYPTTPYTPGPVTFASAIGNTQSRWNSYMLT